MVERKFGLGVIVVIFSRDFSKVFLLKRNKEKRARNGLDWGNVGGRVELGELLQDACVREAREETGLSLDKSNLKLLEVKETPFLSETFHALHFIYAITLDEKSIITLNDESEEYGWFRLDSLPEKTLDSKEKFIEWRRLAKLGDKTVASSRILINYQG